MKITKDNTRSFFEALEKLTGAKVMVGIPSDTEQHFGSTGREARTDTTIGNATLGYIHENGSPARNIPARPFLAPGVANSKDKWTNYLKQAATLASEGKTAAVDRALHAAGQTAVNAVKATIAAGIPPPLAQSTIDARRQRSRGSSYRRAAVVASDTTPLIDTGQLINSISYAIRRKRT
jgi:hypothetical protein